MFDVFASIVIRVFKVVMLLQLYQLNRSAQGAHLADLSEIIMATGEITTTKHF